MDRADLAVHDRLRGTLEYRSKIDWWVATVMVISMALSVYASALVVLAGSSTVWWLVPLIAGSGIGMPLWLLSRTRYILGSSHLLIVCGPLKWRVPIESITSITPTSNPLASPALSLDRLRIEYGHGYSVIISPRRKDEFLRRLQALRVGSEPSVE